MLDIHDVLMIEETAMDCNARLSESLKTAKQTKNPSQVCILPCASYSDCVGTLRVNLEVLKRTIHNIENSL